MVLLQSMEACLVQSCTRWPVLPPWPIRPPLTLSEKIKIKHLDQNLHNSPQIIPLPTKKTSCRTGHVIKLAGAAILFHLSANTRWHCVGCHKYGGTSCLKFVQKLKNIRHPSFICHQSITKYTYKR